MKAALKTTRLLLIVALAFVAGCYGATLRHYHVVSTHAISHVDIISYSDSMEPYVPLWRAEVARRFPDAVIIIGHGNDVKGQWQLTPDIIIGHFLVPLPPIPVIRAIQEAKAKYPGRTIVVVSCNPGHYKLTESGVAYALDSVFCVPDRIEAGRSGDSEPGSVFEFEYND